MVSGNEVKEKDKNQLSSSWNMADRVLGAVLGIVGAYLLFTAGVSTQILISSPITITLGFVGLILFFAGLYYLSKS